MNIEEENQRQFPTLRCRKFRYSLIESKLYNFQVYWQDPHQKNENGSGNPVWIARNHPVERAKLDSHLVKVSARARSKTQKPQSIPRTLATRPFRAPSQNHSCSGTRKSHNKATARAPSQGRTGTVARHSTSSRLR